MDTGGVFPVNDSNLTFKIQIVRPFIGSVVIPPKLMFNVYVTTTENDRPTVIVYQITYSGVITVPQNCVINAGQTVTVDFGALYHGDFTRAGQRPDSVAPKPLPCRSNATLMSTHRRSLPCGYRGRQTLVSPTRWRRITRTWPSS